MMTTADLDWFADRTAAAPEALRRRAEFFAQGAASGDLVAQLAEAGGRALDAAMAAGEKRAAALDLLAADALITLSLLAQSERDPSALGVTARALRIQTRS